MKVDLRVKRRLGVSSLSKSDLHDDFAIQVQGNNFAEDINKKTEPPHAALPCKHIAKTTFLLILTEI